MQLIVFAFQWWEHTKLLVLNTPSDETCLETEVLVLAVDSEGKLEGLPFNDLSQSYVSQLLTY